MQLEKCIKERRSVRKYTDMKIPAQLLEGLVELSRFSPSWKNVQPVRYHFIQDPKAKELISQNCVMGFEFNAKTISRCNTLLLLTVIKGLSGYEKDSQFSTSKGAGWEMFDAGIAAQTFCLAAHDQGIGSVIMGIFDDEKICQYVKIPENEKIAALIALGYPIETGKVAPPRIDTDKLMDVF